MTVGGPWVVMEGIFSKNMLNRSPKEFINWMLFIITIHEINIFIYIFGINT